MEKTRQCVWCKRLYKSPHRFIVCSQTCFLERRKFLQREYRRTVYATNRKDRQVFKEHVHSMKMHVESNPLPSHIREFHVQEKLRYYESMKKKK